MILTFVTTTTSTTTTLPPSQPEKAVESQGAAPAAKPRQYAQQYFLQVIFLIQVLDHFHHGYIILQLGQQYEQKQQ